MPRGRGPAPMLVIAARIDRPRPRLRRTSAIRAHPCSPADLPAALGSSAPWAPAAPSPRRLLDGRAARDAKQLFDDVFSWPAQFEATLQSASRPATVDSHPGPSQEAARNMESRGDAPVSLGALEHREGELLVLLYPSDAALEEDRVFEHRHWNATRGPAEEPEPFRAIPNHLGLRRSGEHQGSQRVHRAIIPRLNAELHERQIARPVGLLPGQLNEARVEWLEPHTARPHLTFPSRRLPRARPRPDSRRVSRHIFARQDRRRAGVGASSRRRSPAQQVPVMVLHCDASAIRAHEHELEQVALLEEVNEVANDALGGGPRR